MSESKKDLRNEQEKELEDLIIPFGELLQAKGYQFILAVNHSTGASAHATGGTMANLLGLATEININQRTAYIDGRDSMVKK